MARSIDGVAVGSIAVGSLLLYAGITGKNIPQAIQSLISGKGPAAGKNYPISGTAGAPVNAPTGNPAGSLAAIADSYIGRLTYVYGGPNPGAPGTVDCSSFASLCLNQAGVADPGGQPYSATSHGPNTGMYLLWGGAVTVGHISAAAQPGDLIVYQTHMGICDGPDSMVSAQTPASGVQRSSIDGMTNSLGEFLFVRRIAGGIASAGPH